MKTFVLMMVSLLFAISSEAQNKSFYDFTVKTIDGKDFPLSSLKGKKVLVVNWRNYMRNIKKKTLLLSVFRRITLWDKNRVVMRK